MKLCQIVRTVDIQNKQHMRYKSLGRENTNSTIPHALWQLGQTNYLILEQIMQSMWWSSLVISSNRTKFSNWQFPKSILPILACKWLKRKQFFSISFQLSIHPWLISLNIDECKNEVHKTYMEDFWKLLFLLMTLDASWVYCFLVLAWQACLLNY